MPQGPRTRNQGRTLSDWKKAESLAALAAAHAECGNFKEAIRWEKKALKVGFPTTSDQEKARGRLAEYEGGKPCRVKLR